MKEKVIDYLKKYKYPLIIFAVGLCLLLPESFASTNEQKSEKSEETSLQTLLSMSEGAGDTYVLVSDKGVVVVSEGAEKPLVKLNIINAVKAYTGFSADRITVLKMVN